MSAPPLGGRPRNRRSSWIPARRALFGTPGMLADAGHRRGRGR